MKLSATTKGIMLGTLAFSAVGLLVGIFLAPEPLNYAIGVAIGCAMSVFKVFLLERAVYKLTEGDDKKAAQNAMRLGYTARYALTAVALVAAVLLLGPWGFVGAFVGTMAMTLAAIVVKIFVKEETSAETNSERRD